MLAGVFIGFGVILVFTISATLQGSPWTKLVMGGSFTMALSLVVMAGAELFTGNNMVMCSGSCSGTVSWGETVRLWVACFLGNSAGLLLMVALYRGTGLSTEGFERAIAATTEAKMSATFLQLFIRAMFCNALVCFASWCATKCKSEAGKLIMFFWCIFAFFTSGFEHSVTNIAIMALGLLAPHGADLTLAGYFYNIFVTTIGNVAGGVLFVALPYYLIAGRPRATR